MILEGRAKAAERDIELAMFTAWQTARLSSFSDKLDPLKTELARLNPQPPRRQTPEEMLAALRAITASVAH